MQFFCTLTTRNIMRTSSKVSVSQLTLGIHHSVFSLLLLTLGWMGKCRISVVSVSEVKDHLRIDSHSCILNPYSPNVTFLYPLKTSQNRMFSDVFRGHRNVTLEEYGLKLLKRSPLDIVIWISSVLFVFIVGVMVVVSNFDPGLYFRYRRSFQVE